MELKTLYCDLLNEHGDTQQLDGLEELDRVGTHSDLLGLVASGVYVQSSENMRRLDCALIAGNG